MMLLKRLAAIVMSLILLAQLAACNPKSPSGSVNGPLQSTSSEVINFNNTSESGDQDTEDSYQDSVKDEIHNDDTSASSDQNINNSHQDVSRDETSDDNTTASGNQNSDDSHQDNVKDEIHNDNISTQCNHGTDDPYQDISKTEFYADYNPACCNLDATYRSKHGFLSGSLDVPGQYAKEAANRPMSDGKFIRNTATVYLDNGNTYVVMDGTGDEVMRIHKAGGYITLEEVAAYMYAFGGDGTIPANYVSKKSGRPNSSIWGEYLRVNHSYFIGDTDKYPYEPELPDISGCGGSLRYYEMDIGTTGTTTPGYAPKPYVQGNKITRGAARLVYTRCDLNNNGIYESNEMYVFYTHNHYNDFREYLNYYGGWGEMFGNVTGGGEYSSKTKANPTPYVKTDYADFSQQ